MLFMNYLGTSFMLLTFEKGWSFSHSVYHFIFILIVVLLTIFRVLNIPRKAAKLEEKITKQADAKKTN